jgi:hypothetical protein
MSIQTSNYNDKKNIPLKSVKVTGTLFDFTGEIFIEQTYVNNYDKPIEAKYTFNLDKTSCVTDFNLTIGSKKLKGVIKESGKAKTYYETAVKNNHKSSILETSGNGSYKISLGNIEPNETIIIKFKYITMTTIDSNGFKFILPTNIAPKYTPNKSTTLKEMYYNDIQYSTNIPYNFIVDITWNSKNKITNVVSHSNPNDLNVIINDNIAKIITQTTPSNGDFNLIIKTEVNPAIYYYQENEKYYTIITNQIDETNVKTIPKNYYFVLDRSGSMQGNKIKNALEALKGFILSIVSGDNFNIYSFGSEYKSMWNHCKPYNNENMTYALSEISKYTADMGGTEIMECLKDILSNNNSDNESVIILLTDGQVSNVNAITNMIKQKSHNVRIFSLGIGSDVSRDLLEKISSVSNGFSTMLVDESETTNAVINILDKVNKKYYTNIKYNYLHNNEQINALYTNNVIYPGQYITIPLLMTSDQFNMMISDGIVFEGMEQNLIPFKQIMTSEFILNTQNPIIKQYYGNYLIKRAIENRENRENIVNMSIDYHLINEYTTFLIINSDKIDSNEDIQTVNVPHYSNNNYQDMSISMFANCDRRVGVNTIGSCHKNASYDINQSSKNTITPKTKNSPFAQSSSQTYMATPKSVTHNSMAAATKSAAYVSDKSVKQSYKLPEPEEEDQDCGFSLFDNDDFVPATPSKSIRFLRGGGQSAARSTRSFINKSIDYNDVTKSSITQSQNKYDRAGCAVTGSYGIKPLDNYHPICNFKQADGSFTLNENSLSAINMKISDLENMMKSEVSNFTKNLAFNIAVLNVLQKLGEMKYKIILINLEKWIESEKFKLSIPTVQK